MKKESKIVIKDLNFYYEEKQAIKELSLEIPKNQIYSILGPANSGITTMLRTLNRLCDLNWGARQEGEVLIDGKNIFDSDVNVTDLRRRVGMVFDVPTTLPMSIFDNVALGPSLKGKKSKKDLEEIVEKALRMSAVWDEVKDRLDTPAARLSGGQQQRVCIARVLALEPEIILLDRPCSALDPISTSKVEESLVKLKEELTIVIAPHTIQQAGRIADKVAFMLMGDLIEEGDTQDIFSFPKDKRTNDYITGRYG